jgi:hypothetical protein
MFLERHVSDEAALPSVQGKGFWIAPKWLLSQAVIVQALVAYGQLFLWKSFVERLDDFFVRKNYIYNHELLQRKSNNGASIDFIGSISDMHKYNTYTTVTTLRY